MDSQQALERYFGFREFREPQGEVISAVLNGEDIFVLMPTGGGKSLCYQLPAILLDGVTVVVSPLVALMKDQVDALTARGLPATFINSSLEYTEVWDRLARAERGEWRLLYVAPERFESGATADRLRAAGRGARRTAHHARLREDAAASAGAATLTAGPASAAPSAACATATTVAALPETGAAGGAAGLRLRVPEPGRGLQSCPHA